MDFLDLEFKTDMLGTRKAIVTLERAELTVIWCTNRTYAAYALRTDVKCGNRTENTVQGMTESEVSHWLDSMERKYGRPKD